MLYSIFGVNCIAGGKQWIYGVVRIKNTRVHGNTTMIKLKFLYSIQFSMEGVFLGELSPINEYDCLLTGDICNFNPHTSGIGEDISRVMLQSECSDNILDMPALGTEPVTELVIFPVKCDEFVMTGADTTADLSVFADETVVVSSSMNIISDDAVVSDPEEIVMDPARFLMGPFQLHDPRSSRHGEAAQDVPQQDEAPATTFIASKRPRRAAAVLAEKRVHEVLKWEKCKESSSMFKNAAMQINDEFDRASRGGRSKSSVLVVDQTIRNTSPVASENRIVVPENEISSDDEGAAEVDCPDVDMHNDNDDDIDNDDDESGSLASFVVSDSYMSEVGAVSDTDSVYNEDGSDSASDNAEGSSCDSDSDSEFSVMESDSENDNDDQCKWSDDAKA